MKDEAEEVTELRSEIAKALEPPLDEAREQALLHSSVDELTSYHARALGEGEAARVQDHLVACRMCREDLLDLAAFITAGRSVRDDHPDLETVAAWRAFRPRLRGRHRSPLLALAASLLIAALGLASWAVYQRGVAEDLRRQLRGLAVPQPDAVILDLFPESGVRSGSEDGASFKRAGEAGYLLLVLNLPQPPAVEVFEADLVDALGHVAWSGKLTMGEYGTFLLGLPRRFLEGEGYRILLFAVENDRRRLLETYPVFVEGG